MNFLIIYIIIIIAGVNLSLTILAGKKISNPANFEFVKQNELITDLTNRKYLPKKHWDIISFGVVGTMGIGKSTLLNAFASLFSEIFENEFDVFATNNPAYIIKHKLFSPKFYQMIVVDDSITAGFDSRRSNSKENVEMSEAFFLIRHELEKLAEINPEAGKGVCFLFFVFQDPSAMDKRMRNNIHIWLLKGYFEEYDSIFPKEVCNWLQKQEYDSIVKGDYEQKGYGLALTKGFRKMSKFFFPEVNFTFRKILKPEPDFTDLKLAISNEFPELLTAKRSLIKGFCLEYIESNEIDISLSELNDIIDVLMYKAYKNEISDSDSEGYFENSIEKAKENIRKLHLDKNFYFIWLCRLAKIGFSKIGKITEGNAGNIHKFYKTFCEQFNLQDKKLNAK